MSLCVHGWAAQPPLKGEQYCLPVKDTLCMYPSFVLTNLGIYRVLGFLKPTALSYFKNDTWRFLALGKMCNDGKCFCLAM